jgi:hypothetical protein
VQSRVESVELLAYARPATAARMMAGVYLILDDLRLLGNQRDLSWVVGGRLDLPI